MALMQLCHVFDADTNRVIFGNTFLPLEAFANLSKFERHRVNFCRSGFLKSLFGFILSYITEGPKADL